MNAQADQPCWGERAGFWGSRHSKRSEESSSSWQRQLVAGAGGWLVVLVAGCRWVPNGGPDSESSVWTENRWL